MKPTPPVRRAVLCAAFCSILLSSCSTLAVMNADGRSWVSGRADERVEMTLSKPTVDRMTNAASIEDEIERLTPLLFSQRGRPFKARGERADYMVDVRAVEREYQEGWKTLRSVCVDIWVRRSDGSAAFALRTAPLAASRIEASGEVTLASSRDLFALLSRNVALVCRELDWAEKKR